MTNINSKKKKGIASSKTGIKNIPKIMNAAVNAVMIA